MSGMHDQIVCEEMLRLVSDLEAIAEKLRDMSEEFPAIERNAKRIQGSIVMMKLNLGE
jgi:hypothetical protein